MNVNSLGSSQAIAWLDLRLQWATDVGEPGSERRTDPGRCGDRDVDLCQDHSIIATVIWPCRRALQHSQQAGGHGPWDFGLIDLRIRRSTPWLRRGSEEDEWCCSGSFPASSAVRADRWIAHRCLAKKSRRGNRTNGAVDSFRWPHGSVLFDAESLLLTKGSATTACLGCRRG